MLRPEDIHVWREADGDYHLEWGGDVRVAAVELDSPIDSASPATEVHREVSNRARITGLATGANHYFRLIDEGGAHLKIPARRLGFEGTPNFRDFGGYTTVDGLQVKWGYLFRSGQLSELSAQDVALLSELKIDVLCDFRREEEQAAEPNRLPAQSAPRVVSLPIIPGSNSALFELSDELKPGEGAEEATEEESTPGVREAQNSQEMFEFMVQVNRDFALAQTERYARMFAEILEVPDARFLVHCAAGKDRTGFAAALFLLALGVSREVVMQDYLLTSRYFNPSDEFERIKKKYQMDLPTNTMLPMLEVHQHYLGAAFEAIDEKYASIEQYLNEELGVGQPELAQLRGRYLQ